MEKIKQWIAVARDNILLLFEVGKTIKRFWNSPWVGIPLWIATAVCVVYWHYHVPAPGYAVGALAVVAGIMSVRKVKILGKIIWVALLICLLITEFHAIDIDRADNEQKQKAFFAEQKTGFQGIATGVEGVITASNKQFDATMKQLSNDSKSQQNQFKTTMQEFSRNESANQTRFDKLMEHEEKLAESLNGDLIPGNDPTPDNICRDGGLSPDAVRIFIGDKEKENVNVIARFPSVVVARSSEAMPIPKNDPRYPPEGARGMIAFGARSPSTYVPVVSLDRSPDGKVTVLLDLKSSDGRLIVRMNSKGFVVNHNNFFEMEKEKSHLRIVGEDGEEVLNVTYFNQHAIGVSGKGIDMPTNIRGFCATESGPVILFP